MKRTNPIVISLSFLLATSLAQTQVNSQNASQTSSSVLVDSGKIRFYETKQIRGEETYQINQLPNGELIVHAKTDLPFAEQEKKPIVSATLRTAKDLTPQSFAIKGPTLLEIEEDTSISVQGKTASIQDRGQNKSVEVPRNFFAMSGYVPVTLEMMLIRYWLAHGRPASIALLPQGEAFVEFRGKDRLTLSGSRTIELSRYQLSGKNWRAGWGRQTLWLDDENRFVAAVNLGSDIETNLYAFREGYELSSSFFLKRAVEDAIGRLTQLANELSPKPTSPTALIGGTLIDVTGKPPTPNAVVLIEGDRIVAAGPRSTIKIPDGSKVIDATGRFLLPGLWDMHAHFYQTEFGPAYLAAGITTARDVGNDIEFGTSLRDAAKEERGLGPRMLLAGYIDGKTEHGFDVQVETLEEARAAVQRYKNAGYEQIKIRDNVKPETLKVICAEAHRLGMTVTGHVPQGMNALQAVDAGMDQLSHMNYAETGFFPKRNRSDLPLAINLNAPNVANALKLFKEHGTVIDPTDAVLELMIRPMNITIESFEPGVTKIPAELTVQIDKKGGPANEAAGLRMVLDVFLKITAALHRAGVPIVAGTDVGVPGHTLYRELELYVKAGLTPLEAIQAATIVPARVMKLDTEVGTIEAGKRADLVILDANPLDNISNIRKVRFVVTQGRLFDCSKLWESVGFKP
jgi:imidazolonepropionase-like amidohydrolase